MVAEADAQVQPAAIPGEQVTQLIEMPPVPHRGERGWRQEAQRAIGGGAARSGRQAVTGEEPAGVVPGGALVGQHRLHGHEPVDVLAAVNACPQRGARFGSPDAEQRMGCGYPDRLDRAVLPQRGQDGNGRLVPQLPENAELAGYRPVAGKTADRRDADGPGRPSLRGVEAIPLTTADARTASEVRVAKESLADGIK